MSWHGWKRSDWNDVLIRSVFDVGGPRVGPVRIIDVTPAFLASVVGEDPESGKDVRSSFVGAFHVGPRKARELFDVDVQLGSAPVRVDSAPSFFAQLYLSCIVASATEDTHDEGNFRRRLATILGLDVDLDYLSRHGLAWLWEALRDWSVAASDAGRPIRPLVLPDPGHETIIGYSKRLAFPSYRDQRRLARLIAEEDLSSDSPIERILTAVGSRAESFSRRFRREFRAFRTSVTSTDSDATETAFWAAFESIYWTPAQKKASGKPHLKFVLTFSVPDPNLEVLITRVSDTLSGGGWRVEPLPYDVEGCDGRVVGDGDTDDATLLRYFLAGGDFRGAFRGGYLQRMVGQGCVPFGHGESYPWVSVRSLPRTGDAWLLLRDDLVDEVIRGLSAAMSEARELDRIRRIRIPTAGEWALVGPVRCGEGTRKLSGVTPFDRLDAFASIVTGSRLHVRQAIRLPDGTLFLKPRLPEVSCAVANEVAVYVGEQSPDRVLRLRPLEDGFWRFPRWAADSLPVPGRFTIRAIRNGAFADARVLRTIRTCSLLDEGYRFSAGTYACETDAGQLAPLDELCEGPIEEDVSVESIEGAAGRVTVRLPDLLPSVSRPAASEPEIEWSPVREVPGEWWDVLEVFLALTNLRANGFSWEEFVSIVRKGLSIDDQFAARIVAENLIQNRLVLRLVSTKSRGVSFFAYPPFLSRSEEDTEIRIGGVLGRLRQTRLLEWAEARNQEVHVATLGRFEALGTIRITGAQPADAQDLAEHLGVDFESPFGRGSLPNPEKVLTRTTRKVRLGDRPPDTELWSPRSRVSARALIMESRRPEREPASYVLLKEGEAVWGTQSRYWAQLIFALVVERRPWSLDRNGTLFLSLAAPEVFGRWIGSREGGVCGRTWSVPVDTRWVYPFLSEERALEWLGTWVHSERSRTSPALRRWARGYARQDPGQGRAEVFARRYLD